MSNIKPKEGADLVEGIRLAFNARMYANLHSSSGKYIHLNNKLIAEDLLDTWIRQNLDGLPEKLETNVD